MNRRLLKQPTTWLAAGLWVVILGMAGAIVAMKANGWQGAGNTSDTSGVALFLALFAFATMGALVAAHVPRNPIGWIFLAIPFLGAVAGITENLAFQGLVHDPGSVPGALAFAWIYSWAWYPLIGLLPFVLLLYPTGALPGPRWRLLAWALGVVLAVMTLGYMFYPGPLDKDPRLPANPLGIEALKGLFDRSDTAASISMAGLVLAAVASVIVRFYRSRGDERQQIKWMAFAAAVLAFGFVAQGLLGLGDVTFAATISMLPVGLGIALFRYRLYDIDRVINRTLVYGASSALLAARTSGSSSPARPRFHGRERLERRGRALDARRGWTVPAGSPRVQGSSTVASTEALDAQQTLEASARACGDEADLDGLRV